MTEAVIKNLFALFYLGQHWCADIITQKVLIARSRDERRRGAGSQVGRNHFYTQA